VTSLDLTAEEVLTTTRAVASALIWMSFATSMGPPEGGFCQGHGTTLFASYGTTCGCHVRVGRACYPRPRSIELEVAGWHSGRFPWKWYERRYGSGCAVRACMA
jgi:hypothetical protein